MKTHVSYNIVHVLFLVFVIPCAAFGQTLMPGDIATVQRMAIDLRLQATLRDLRGVVVAERGDRCNLFAGDAVEIVDVRGGNYLVRVLSVNNSAYCQPGSVVVLNDFSMLGYAPNKREQEIMNRERRNLERRPSNDFQPRDMRQPPAMQPLWE
ncbi:hypothetical protein [Desulfocurvibacter africanus]|uniref:hypothetical protein n=1 Tax=Desulfocurvibacter africanus TaxID=873 RepID=UPI0004261532|nr:hypothetical protein [Desulfocurvibacter africanus]